MKDMAGLAAHLKLTAPDGIPVTGHYLRQCVRKASRGVCSPRDYPQEGLLLKISAAVKGRRLPFDDVFPPGKIGRSELLKAHGPLFGRSTEQQPQLRPGTAPASTSMATSMTTAGLRSADASGAMMASSPVKKSAKKSNRNKGRGGASTGKRAGASKRGGDPSRSVFEKNYSLDPLTMSRKEQLHSVYGYLQARKMSPIMKALVDPAPSSRAQSTTRPRTADGSSTPGLRSATATAAAAATTYRNLSAKERFNELKARNPVLGRLTESNPSSMHLAQMLDRDVRFRRPYGLHFIRRNELLRIKAVTVPAPQMWLVFKCCHMLLGAYREVTRRHLHLFRVDDFAYDNDLHLDLRPPAVDPAAEVASTFSWPAAQRELANPRMLLLKLQTVVHIVFEYGIEPPALLQELESIAERGIFRPDKIESVSMACAHLCQWVLDVIEIARRHSLAHDDDDEEEEEEEGVNKRWKSVSFPAAGADNIITNAAPAVP